MLAAAGAAQSQDLFSTRLWNLELLQQRNTEAVRSDKHVVRTLEARAVAEEALAQSILKVRRCALVGTWRAHKALRR